MARHSRREPFLKLRDLGVMLAVGAVCAAVLFGPELARRGRAKSATRKRTAQAARPEAKRPPGAAITPGAALQPELAVVQPPATEPQPARHSAPVLSSPSGPLVDNAKVQFRFSADGADRPLKKATGEEIPPSELAARYGQELAILDAGQDVCSSEYAARRRWPETKRPVAADLAKWESARVAPGTVAIDPKLGRLKFSQGSRAEFKELGRVHIGWGEPNDLAIQGSRLFLALAESSFNVCIYDISQPASPAKLGMVAHPKSVVGSIEWPSRIAVSGKCLFIPSRSKTVGVVDISNPSQPRRLTNFVAVQGDLGPDGAGRVQSLVADGQFLYVYLWKAGLSVWDIANPTSPKQVGFVQPPGAFDNLSAKPRIKGKHLLFPDKTALLSFDISTPSEPRLAQTLPIPCTSVWVAGDLAYLACGEQGIAVVDVRDPGAMSPLGRCGLSGSADEVAAAGRHAFVTLRDKSGERPRFAVVDVSNPASPIEIGIGSVDPRSACCIASDDPRRPSRRVPVFNADEINVDFSGVAAVGQHVFLSDVRFGLRVFDVSDPRQPRLVSGFKESGEVSAIYTCGDYAYAG
ncbi:MAG: hypothetical protein FJ279_33825, partial [Planctomycetes bacterium]|nr:hypothetical protein [Planctomycetota bacterium]